MATLAYGIVAQWHSLYGTEMHFACKLFEERGIEDGKDGIDEMNLGGTCAAFEGGIDLQQHQQHQEHQQQQE